MTDIVDRLRATGGNGQGGKIRAEAADEIERLRALLGKYQVGFETSTMVIANLKLLTMIDESKRREMTQEEREAMLKAQRESWARQDMD